MFVLGNGAHRRDVALDIFGNERAVASYTTLQVNHVVGMADGADALADRRALSGETLGLLPRGVHSLQNLCRPPRHLRETTRTTFCTCVVDVGEALLDLGERCFRLRYGFVSRPLCGGHRCRHRLAACMLHMSASCLHLGGSECRWPLL
jgi:hypothetical protein